MLLKAVETYEVRGTITEVRLMMDGLKNPGQNWQN